jgi:hypothetical protein
MTPSRQAILDAMQRCLPGVADMHILKAETGLRAAAIREELRALRWAGFVQFDRIALPDSKVSVGHGGAGRPASMKEPSAVAGSLPAASRAENAPQSGSIPDTFQPVPETVTAAPIPPGGGDTAGVEAPAPASAPAIRKPPLPRARCTLPPVDLAAVPDEFGTRAAPQMTAKPLPRDWMAERRARIAAATAFLKSKCVLVTRTAPGSDYFRVSGKRFQMMAEEVVEHAIALGWTE